MTIDREVVLRCAREAALAAGRVLRSNSGAPGPVRWKPSGPVTDADLEAERVIVEAIRADFPDHAILSEEMGAAGTGPFRWILDPLDGTANFVRRMPWYDVSVAFEVDGIVEVGVVCAPALDLLFTAVRGRGAQLNGRTIRASEARVLEGSVVEVDFRRQDWADPARTVRLAALAEAGVDLRSLAACGLDLAFVAAGWLDGLWSSAVSLWDWAAGGLLVTEAGGRVATWEPADDRGGDRTLLAAGAGLHPLLDDLLGLSWPAGRARP
jgi:myo-inositol-1(or 4)-monophosphatase